MLAGYRHAEYFRDLFERAETEQRTGPTAEWLALPAESHGRCKQVPFVNVERIDFELKRPTEALGTGQAVIGSKTPVALFAEFSLIS